ncbi:PKD domain-containing protein [Streptomyces sp. Ag109_O5-1]|uniref:PKD domain-containing protein n=1 Tax=Streptomyces sp. Ag109_O5-1 TaxID=1938851 RepID=UPI000F50F676|nr:PKD domain-containing protein [Streptomyces sp. Ag109_O5-1]RPE42679.1 PKD domain-containing protein [Streptomyces sp. Ag109_O5-1]
MRRSRPAVGLSLAVIVAVGAMSDWGSGTAAAAPGADGTLYVNHDVACSDTGTGTQSLPFCTVQAAADVAEPGDMVRIMSPDAHPYREAVTLTRSGTSDAPITFTGAPSGTTTWAELTTSGSAPTLTLKGVHDVRVQSLIFQYDATDALVSAGSDHITLDGLTFGRSSAPSDGGTGTAITVDGTSSDVTVERNTIGSGYAYGVRTAQGAVRVTVTTNVIDNPRLGGITATGTAGMAVTSNSLASPCAPGISLAGGSSGAVENNVVAAPKLLHSSTCPAPTTPLYTVSDDSAGQVTDDYNVAADTVGGTTPRRTEYLWAGTSYATAAALQNATGQGAHDIDGVGARLEAPPEHSPLIDSADSDAPGELTTDAAGAPGVDDPLVDDAGPGTAAHRDRGAFERQDTIAIPTDGGGLSPRTGLAPLSTSVRTDDFISRWGEPLTYSVDFGDGTAPVTAPAGEPIGHTYASSGSYQAKTTVTDTEGVSSARQTAQVVAGTAEAPNVSLSGTADTASAGQIAAGLAVFAVPPSSAPWEIHDLTLAFGDGSDQSLALPTGTQQVRHQYPAPGTYTATLTQTDLLGRTTTARTTFHAADTFVAMTPQHDTEKTIAAHGVLKLSAATLRADSDGVDAAQLQLVTRGARANGALTLYTHGTTRPNTAAITFEPGRTATAETTVKVTPTGSVDVYNGSSGAVTVDVATVGLQSHAQYADTYHPVTPVRLLDTRTGTGGVRSPVAGGHSVTLAVGGTHGVPAGADAVVLNVTATTTKASGDLTVATHSTNDSVVSGPYWTTGQTATTQVVIPVYDGKVVLHNDSKASADLVADLAGWYGTATGGSEFLPVTPARILDTRTGTGTGKVARLAGHATLKLKVTGAHGVPATGVTAADLDLTVAAPSGSGYLVAYPDGTPRPGVYSLSFAKGHTAAGRSLVKVGTDSEIDLYNAGSSPVDITADLLGDYGVYPAG